MKIYSEVVSKSYCKKGWVKNDFKKKNKKNFSEVCWNG